MPNQSLRHVDASRPPGRLRRAYSWIGATRFGLWLSRLVNWRLDPILLRVTRGRVASTLMVPSAVLETRGARTGLRRRNAVIYFHDGGRVIIAASHGGRPSDPSWFYNVRAYPDEVALGGVPMRARVIEDSTERARLWQMADRVFPAFSRYRATAAAANRTIPLIALEPR